MMRNVTDYLERTAAQFPDKAAVADANGSVSFARLRADARAIGTALLQRAAGTMADAALVADFAAAATIAANANTVAEFTADATATADAAHPLRTPVVVFLEKSARCLTAFLGAAYAGAFYTPIDQSMPCARMQKILDTLHAPVLLAPRAALAFIRESLSFGGEILVYEDIVATPADARLLASVRAQMLDADLLYVLFTSGSTGSPKGVCIAHAAVINFAEAIVPLYGITHRDIFGNQAAFYFDLSVMDIVCMLKAGATLYILDGDLFAQPVALLRALRDHAITAIAWVPSALVMVSKLRALQSVDVSATLNKVLFIGEVMPTKQFNRWQAALPNALFSNFYGPTEATVACTAAILRGTYDDAQPLPIGTPLANYDVFLLDESGARVPKTDCSTCGELCVRGISVARGYYNNPAMTAAAFTPNPLSPAVPEVIYHTGDWAHYDAKGTGAFVYIGRRDFQIKHMGHRIELGEIEAAAMTLHGMAACACVYDERRSKIVLFCETAFAPACGAALAPDCEATLAPDHATALAPAQIIARMKALVPQYMCPSRVVVVPALPLNANGKIDRGALCERLH